jgi:hypothetical protein
MLTPHRRSAAAVPRATDEPPRVLLRPAPAPHRRPPATAAPSPPDTPACTVDAYLGLRQDIVHYNMLLKGVLTRAHLRLTDIVQPRVTAKPK